MAKRIATIKRKTKETQIELTLSLDGAGSNRVKSPVPFLNHMLEAFSKHSGFDLRVTAQGDTHIDDHHTVEDIGICLGMALDKALGDKHGISRYGFFY
ncbi:MAG TPA: imidazoleglycerol-phosphate dehydratase, partial [bacterium]|nr:imidazoleglycerol-phosphate dehydratase [bacterium]